MRGYIRRRGKGSFELTLELDAGADGKRRRRFANVKGSHRDAQRALAKMLAEADAGTLTDPSKMTLAAYMQQSLDAAHELAPKTRERYAEIAARWVAPYLGAHKLPKLTREHIKTWHATLLATGLAPRSVLHAHRLVSRVLSEAVAGNIVAGNVAAKAKPPAVPDSELEILDADQVTAVLEALKGGSLYPIAALAIASGMRRGELCALQWADIDLDRGVARVERSVEETRAGLRLKQPKTRAGRRNVALAPDTVAMLRAHRAEQMRVRLALGQGGPPNLVFGTLEDELSSPDNLSGIGAGRSAPRGCRSSAFTA